MKDIKQIYDLDEAVRQHGDAMTRIKISLMRLPRSSENPRLSHPPIHPPIKTGNESQNTGRAEHEKVPHRDG